MEVLHTALTLFGEVVAGAAVLFVSAFVVYLFVRVGSAAWLRSKELSDDRRARGREQRHGI
jgi:hypothetical protein